MLLSKKFWKINFGRQPKRKSFERKVRSVSNDKDNSWRLFWSWFSWWLFFGVFIDLRRFRYFSWRGLLRSCKEFLPAWATWQFNFQFLQPPDGNSRSWVRFRFLLNWFDRSFRTRVSRGYNSYTFPSKKGNIQINGRESGHLDIVWPTLTRSFQHLWNDFLLDRIRTQIELSNIWGTEYAKIWTTTGVPNVLTRVRRLLLSLLW